MRTSWAWPFFRLSSSSLAYFIGTHSTWKATVQIRQGMRRRLGSEGSSISPQVCGMGERGGGGGCGEMRAVRQAGK